MMTRIFLVLACPITIAFSLIVIAALTAIAITFFTIVITATVTRLLVNSIVARNSFD